MLDLYNSKTDYVNTCTSNFVFVFYFIFYYYFKKKGGGEYLNFKSIFH